jgi:DNA-binding response OmpR family regulator
MRRAVVSAFPRPALLPVAATPKDQIKAFCPDALALLEATAPVALRILVVEDDPMIGPLLAEILEELGHVVCGLETDAQEAVRAAARLQPDLMIVDIGLGEASGVAAVNQILRERFVPHVFVTGDVLRNLSLGPGAVLIQKPFGVPEIIAAISRAVLGGGCRRRRGDVETPVPLIP